MPDRPVAPSSPSSAPSLGFAFHLPPEEAIKYFEQKGNTLTWNWWEMWEADHARAFTVAKATTLDILSDIRSEVKKAIDEGITLEQFTKELQPKLEAKGWWGKKVIENDGEKTVTLGTPGRLKTIFNANVQSSYMAGRYKQMMEVADTMPYWQYLAVLDPHTRDEHRMWHGMVVRYDDPWWDYHYPPNGWNCRCRVRALSEAQVERMNLTPQSPETKFKEWTNKATGEVKEVPEGVDPGWGYNVGKASWSPNLDTYPPDIKALWDAPKGLPVEKYEDIGKVVGERLDGYFKRGFKGVEFNEEDYLMSTDGKGKIQVSGKKVEGTDFNPKQELLSAMKKLGKEDLTFNEEYSLESVWHEIIHNQEVLMRLPQKETNPRRVLMETLTQFVARHTYPDMLKTLANAPAIHQAGIIESGYGYGLEVSGFRSWIKSLGIADADILDETISIVKNHPQIDYMVPVCRMLSEKTGIKASDLISELWDLMSL